MVSTAALDWYYEYCIQGLFRRERPVFLKHRNLSAAGGRGARAWLVKGKHNTTALQQTECARIPDLSPGGAPVRASEAPASCGCADDVLWERGAVHAVLNVHVFHTDRRSAYKQGVCNNFRDTYQ